MNSSILIIDDDSLVRESFGDALVDEGYKILYASGSEEARSVLEHEDVHAILLDVWLGQHDGLELLPQVLNAPSQPVVVMISGHGTIETAVKATKRGAYDFLEKPVSLDRLTLTLRHALESRDLKLENTRLRSGFGRSPILIGKSSHTEMVKSIIQSSGKTSAPLLIKGENGTGKEVVARLAHDMSSRRNKPFVAVNCAAIPESLIESELFGYEKGAFTGAHTTRLGKIESAQGGTVFLDEIGDLSLSAQAKLLRVLQEKVIYRVGGINEIPVNVRWVAATNRDLIQMVQDRIFREDLLYRINVIQILLHPLRERIDDIQQLASHFLSEACAQMELSQKVLSQGAIIKLQEHQWPGNVRELKNTMERTAAFCDHEIVEADDVRLEPSLILARKPYEGKLEHLLEERSFREARAGFERQYLQSQLARFGGNISRLATHIGLERSYLYRKLKQYELAADSP